jgi:hypothetical protein
MSEGSDGPTAGDSASTLRSSDVADHQAMSNVESAAMTAAERGVGLLPGIIASLERRFKAAAMSSNNRRQPTADGRSMLSRLADVLARYGLRLPSGLLQASSLHPNDICSRVNADRMKRERAMLACLFTFNSIYSRSYVGRPVAD